jgi:small subunit ribosomal protein S5
MSRIRSERGDRDGRGRGDRDRDRRGGDQTVESEFTEEVIHINRVAKVVKGGRKFHFAALVAVGDRKGRVGLGYGKASEVVDAIRKGVDDAKRNMIKVYREGTSIPYMIRSHYCASTILLRPAAKGHGIIAGGSARPILALSGIEDVSAKFVGSNNAINCARATFQALKLIQRPDVIGRLRSGEKVDRLGRFVSDQRKAVAEEALEQIAAIQPTLDTGLEGGEEA